MEEKMNTVVAAGKLAPGEKGTFEPVLNHPVEMKQSGPTEQQISREMSRNVTQSEAGPQTRKQEREQRKIERLKDYARQEGIVTPDADPTAEDLRQARKMRRDKLFASIGDGIQALSNLYFTTQYAPSSYDPKHSALRQTQVNYDRMLSQREKARKDALAEKIAAANIGRDQIALALKQDRWNWEKERGKREDDRKDEQQVWEREKHGLEMTGLGDKNRKAAADADTAEAKAARADEYEQSRINKNKAATTASYARASAAGGGNKYYGEFMGEKYKTRADYEKAVLDAAREKGVDIYDTEVTERSYSGKPTKERKVKRSIAAIAAEASGKDRKETGGWSLK